MIRFKDNPNLKLKTVKTVRGETEYKRNCKKIKDKYYVLHEDVVLIGEKWYATTSKLVTFDYEKKVYVLIKQTPLVYGIVKVDAEGNSVFGYFTENKYNNVWINVSGYGNIKALNAEILEGSHIENISDGIWYSRKGLTPASISKMSRIESRKVHTNKGYNIEDNAVEFRDKIDSYSKAPMKISVAAAKYGRMLGSTTFGCEIETSMGNLPDHIQHRTGVVVCRDGSIDNAEFVTVPMKGARGLVNLKYLSSELCKRTVSDIKCSFHIHLGSLPTDRLFIVALYALSIRIQDEIFKMFPYYKTEWKGIKKQNYNQKTRKLGIPALKAGVSKDEYTKYVDEAYYRIFTFLNDGISPDDRFNRNNHRHNQTHKWNRKQRYFWLNFMNLFFSERKTAEFRLHHNTLNGQKMVNWLFICNAIVRYAEKNAKQILSSGNPIPMDEILNYYADTFPTKEGKFLSSYLKAYATDRTKYFTTMAGKGDYICEAEIKEDKTYTFEHEGVSWLF
jgi:hypothetical protein